MSKHTPGPWEVKSVDKQTWQIGTADFGSIVTLHDPYRASIRMTAEMEADARLIAAAPDLLEALKKVKQMISEALPKFNWRDSFLDANAIRLLNEVPLAVYEAVAKAEGK